MIGGLMGRKLVSAESSKTDSPPRTQKIIRPYSNTLIRNIV